MSREVGINRYEVLGIGLVVFGILITVLNFLMLHNTPFNALGILCVIMGVTSALIPDTPVPAESVRAMIEGSCANIEALLEQFNAVERCIYLPPKDDRVYAYVPLGNSPFEGLATLIMAAPVRVVTEVKGEPGLMVNPPGSEVVRHAAIEKGGNIEDALSYVLVDFVEAMESIKAVQDYDTIVVQMRGIRLETEFPRYRKVLGSLPTSMVGCVLSYVLGKPVGFLDEKTSGNLLEARFKVENNV